MCFCEDLTATQTAKILQINRNTINEYFNQFRMAIFALSNKAGQKLSGEIELDESYFEAKRVRGKRGRGAAGKTPIFRQLESLQWVNFKWLRPLSCLPFTQ